MQCTEKYSQHSSTIWPVWLNGWCSFFRTKWLCVRITLLSLQVNISLLTSTRQWLLLFCTVTDFAIFLNEGNFVFGNASWNFFAPFSTNPSVANASESFLSSSWVSRITSVRRLLNRQTFFTCKYSKWVVFLQSSYHFCNRFLAQQDLRWTKRSVLLWGTVNVSHFFYSCSISCLVSCVQEPF